MFAFFMMSTIKITGIHSYIYTIVIFTGIGKKNYGLVQYIFLNIVYFYWNIRNYSGGDMNYYYFFPCVVPKTGSYILSRGHIIFPTHHLAENHFPESSFSQNIIFPKLHWAKRTPLLNRNIHIANSELYEFSPCPCSNMSKLELSY